MRRFAAEAAPTGCEPHGSRRSAFRREGVLRYDDSRLKPLLQAASRMVLVGAPSGAKEFCDATIRG